MTRFYHEPADLIAERPDAPFPPAQRLDPMRIALNVANHDAATAIKSRDFWQSYSLGATLLIVAEFVMLVSR